MRLAAAAASGAAPPPSAAPDDVQEDPDRQPRRDRPADPARVPRDGRQVGGRLFRSRPRRQVREAGRRGGLHRPGAVGAELSQHAGDHRHRRGDRRRGDPSRLRLPLRERRLRRARRAQRLHLHRPDARGDPDHGRQGLGQAGDDQVGRAVRPRLRRRAARRSEGVDQGGAGDRLPGHHQGGGRRRRARHARRAHRGGAGVGGADDARRSRRGVRQPGRLHGEVPREPAPHRDPDPRRHAQERGLARRARLLDAAPPPEDHRGGAGARDRAPRDRADRRALRRRVQEDRLPRRRHVRVPVRERRVLLHRDEHPRPGRASGDRAGDRHRHRADADPHRRRREAAVRAARRSPAAATRSSAASTPRIRSSSRRRRAA